MDNYVCCGVTCCRRVTEEERTQELQSDIAKTTKKPLLIAEHQKPVMIIDDSYSNYNSLLRPSYQNVQNELINELSPQEKGIPTGNTTSSYLINSKSKCAVNKRVQSSYYNNHQTDSVALPHFSSNPRYQFTLTNHMNTFNNIFPSEERDMKIRLAEDKIVKRSNLSEYNKNILYGKPSNAYTSERLNLFQTSNQQETVQAKRTFRKFNEGKQPKEISDLYSCEYCCEIYKSLIINHEEMKTIRCPQCGNILNDKSYQYYYRIYSSLSPEKLSSQGGNLDHGRMSDNWNKWIQVKAEQKKENMVYDILSGRTALTQATSNDAKFKRLMATTRDKLKRSNQRYNLKR